MLRLFCCSRLEYSRLALVLNRASVIYVAGCPLNFARLSATKFSELILQKLQFFIEITNHLHYFYACAKQWNSAPSNELWSYQLQTQFIEGRRLVAYL